MPPSPDKQSECSRSSHLARILWALMVAAHIPALVSQTSGVIETGLDPSRLGGIIGLCGATLFFPLKLWGVPCLRFATDTRSLIAIVAGVILIHADVIGASPNGALVPKELPVAATALLAAGMSRAQATVSAVFSSVFRSSRTPAALSLLESAHSGSFTPCLRLVSLRVCTPRAPPA